jgi:hypothetical protein
MWGKAVSPSLNIGGAHGCHAMVVMMMPGSPQQVSVTL